MAFFPVVVVLEDVSKEGTEPEDLYDKTQHVIDRETTRKNSMAQELSKPATHEDYSTIAEALQPSAGDSTNIPVGEAARYPRMVPVYSTVNKLPKASGDEDTSDSSKFTLSKLVDDISTAEDTLRELQACIDDMSNLEAPPPIPPRAYDAKEAEGKDGVRPSAGKSEEDRLPARNGVNDYVDIPSSESRELFSGQEQLFNVNTLNGGQQELAIHNPQVEFAPEQSMLGSSQYFPPQLSSDPMSHNYETVEL